MREPISSMNSSNSATAQAGQVVSLTACREQRISDESFSDNLDYLQALEREGQMILAQALLRQKGAECQTNPDYIQVISIAGILLAESKPDKLAELIFLTEQKNRQRAEEAEQKGIDIYFIKFCRENKIEGINRKLILLLLLLATNERFTEMFDLCNFGNKVRDDSEVKIGTILNIICSDYREQLSSRKYFSLESTLIQQNILHIECNDRDKVNILERYVSMNDRYVRYFVGDNNFYKSASSLIQRDVGTIHLDQVIIPDDTKKDLVSRVSDYLAFRNSKEAGNLDEFYGYGTGLNMLFHGPSGTGKTMTAQGMAFHFNMPLYSLKMSDIRHERIAVIEQAVKDLFLEASLNSGIVYFDEADDFFEKDSLLSRLLLIEIEKARCVVILSTNQPVYLDPAMDRRLSLKVCFSIPDAELRYRIWQALIPGFVNIAHDVDFRKLAERYNFTGGLIKNSIFMAVTSSLTSSGKNKLMITMDMIEQACKLQLQQMYDMKNLYQIYDPKCKCRQINLNMNQKIEFSNIADIYRSLKEKKMGLNILVTSTDIQSGIDVVEALANECNLKIKKVNYVELHRSSDSEYGKIFDPITQTKKTPMELVFAESTGDASILMFIDYYNLTRWTVEKGDWSGFEQTQMYYALLENLRTYKGLFCMVTYPAHQNIPREFNIHFNLEYPPVETQMLQWKNYLNGNRYSDDDLASLIENNPMHITEIDFFAKQALVQLAIEDSSSYLTISHINTVIERYRKQRSKPLLFGRPT